MDDEDQPLLESLDLSREESARRIVRYFDGQAAGLLNYLVNQVATVRQQAQTMLGLCGLIITVTGFSGPRMIESSRLSAWAMVTGIALTLVGAVLSLHVMIQVRWVSEELAKDTVTMVMRVFARRDRQNRQTIVAGFFVAAGLAAYLLSVAITAFASATNGIGGAL